MNHVDSILDISQLNTMVSLTKNVHKTKQKKSTTKNVKTKKKQQTK